MTSPFNGVGPCNNNTGTFVAFENEALKNFLELVVMVIPVSHIFRCDPFETERLRLIIVLDKYRYQTTKATKDLLSFVKISQPHIELLCYSFGTMNDYLKRGHYFFSCIAFL